MTVEELKAKGFEVRVNERFDINKYRFSVDLYTWGKPFIATGDTPDEAASNLWNIFCDFINGRTQE